MNAEAPNRPDHLDLDDEIMAAHTQAQALDILLVAMSERNMPTTRVIDGQRVVIMPHFDWDILRAMADRLIEDIAQIEAAFNGSAAIGTRPKVAAYRAINDLMPHARLKVANP